VQAIKIDNPIENSILPIAFKKEEEVIPFLGFFEDPNFVKVLLPMLRNPFEALPGFEG
jgi:hypothetical protein